jgi:rubrerythrin
MVRPEIEFTLVQNALDSIERAIDLLAWKDVTNEGSRLKQAILLTAHATELLLKERLRRIHPSLVWDEVDKFPRLDARTVGVDRAIHRLKHIGNISLPETDALIVKSLRNTRNAIEHFHWQTTRSEANAIVGQGLSFAIHFAKNELQADIAFLYRKDDTWTQLLTEHSDFARAHAKRVELALAAEGKSTQECSFCHAMTEDLATGACPLCGHWNTQFSDFDASVFDDG